MTKSCFIASTPAITQKAVSAVNVAASSDEWSIPIATLLRVAPKSATTAELLSSITKTITKSASATNKAKVTAVKWHDIPKAEMTDEVKSEISALRLKAFMDPKKFYKSSDLKKTP